MCASNPTTLTDNSLSYGFAAHTVHYGAHQQLSHSAQYVCFQVWSSVQLPSCSDEQGFHLRSSRFLVKEGFVTVVIVQHKD